MRNRNTIGCVLRNATASSGSAGGYPASIPAVAAGRPSEGWAAEGADLQMAALVAVLAW